MKKFRLTFNGMAGFDYKGFNTQKEAIEYAKSQGKFGLMTPLKLMMYNSVKDEYIVVGEFSRV